MQRRASEDVPEALVVLRKYGLGPSETWPIEARVSGPADRRPGRPAGTGGAGIEKILGDSPHAQVVRTNWRQRVKKIVLDYDQRNATVDIGDAR